MAMTTLRLLIVADDPLARTGLALQMAELSDCVIINQVNNLDMETGFYTDLDHRSPDAILWDLGWETAGALPEWIDSSIPIIALLPDDIRVADIWSAGIRAILSRDVEAEKLLDAVQAARQGLIVLEPSLANPLLSILNLTPTNLAEGLTPRESEVLQLLAEGVTNKTIAQRLEISEHTVKFHVNAIMSKLGAQSRTEAVVQATRLGLLLL